MRLTRLNKAAEKFGTSRETFKTWSRRGLITIHKLGRAAFIDEDELIARIKEHTQADRDRRAAARPEATAPAEAAQVA